MTLLWPLIAAAAVAAAGIWALVILLGHAYQTWKATIRDDDDTAIAEAAELRAALRQTRQLPAPAPEHGHYLGRIQRRGTLTADITFQPENER